MERMVKRRLIWALEQRHMIPDHMCAYRRHRGATDALIQLTAAIQLALSKDRISLVSFLDVKQAFDTVKHEAITTPLHQSGITCRLGAFVQGYLESRTIAVAIEGQVSSSRVLTRGVPQGGVLSPILFNIAVSDLHLNAPDTLYTAKYLIYADDICLLFHGKLKPSLQASAQATLNHISSSLATKGLRLSPEKSVALVCAPKGKHIPNSFPALSLQGIPIPRVNKTRYLGIIFHSHLSWTHQVDHMVRSCQPLLNVLKLLCGKSWGNHPRSMLSLYKALILSHMNYTVSFIDPSPTNWQRLERLHRTGLRIALGLPRASDIEETLLEAEELPVRIHAERCLYEVLDRLRLTQSATSVINNIKSCFNTNIGKLCKFYLRKNFKLQPPQGYENSPSPPWRDFFPNTVTTIRSIQGKKHAPAVVSRHKALDHISNHYSCHSLIYTDGSVSQDSASSAYFVPSNNLQWSSRLDSHTISSTSAELCAILHASIASSLHKLNQVVILTHSSAALHKLSDVDNQSVLVKSTLRALELAQKQEINITLQWIPEHADKLARAAHSLPSKPFPIPQECRRKTALIQTSSSATRRPRPPPSVVMHLQQSHCHCPSPNPHRIRLHAQLASSVRTYTDTTMSTVLFKFGNHKSHPARMSHLQRSTQTAAQH
ncbi:uncharacterized protein LOC135374169 [Ornithodoros turicata]|uniref:uncharacterized protein LOC135374169 n=1 Tax=Ornithodoros turicata TaxID=34597 RepID=UPI003139AA05